jgi:hypothetical protein
MSQIDEEQISRCAGTEMAGKQETRPCRRVSFVVDTELVSKSC